MAGERVDRRLAAVLAADVAAYSRLMGADEEGTLTRLKTIRKELVDLTIAKHRGRIVKTTGDGMLVEFASAVDAVRGAVDVQRGMAEWNASVPDDQRIEFRIGIHVGDIIIDDNDIFGDGVNVAARLEGIAEPGGVCMSNDAYRQVRAKVEIVCDDIGPQQLKNIAEPVQVWRVRLTGHASPAVRSGSIASEPQPLPLPDKPSIAVLPFQNMSGDPEQEYFADGMVEDIITALSRFKSLFVIARNSSFTYKGKSVDIKQIGRQLGVRYVLEGSVRKAGNRVRITGQLIEAASNNHLWADKFDGSTEDVFNLQDQVTEAVVALIAPTVVRAEIERAKRKPTDRLDSYDLYLRGVALVQGGSFHKARDLFKKAIEQDPECGPAFAHLAYSYNIQQAVSGRPLSDSERSEALNSANSAAKLGADDAFSLAVAGHVLTYIGRSYDRGLSMTSEAVVLNSNLAAAWQAYGWVALMCDEPEAAVESFDRLMRVSPLDPARRWTWNGKAFALFCSGHYADGCHWAEKAVQSHADAHSLGALIINSVGADRRGNAQKAAVQLLALQPDFRASHSYENYPVRSAVTRDRIYSAFQAAGVPP